MPNAADDGPLATFRLTKAAPSSRLIKGSEIWARSVSAGHLSAGEAIFGVRVSRADGRDPSAPWNGEVWLESAVVLPPVDDDDTSSDASRTRWLREAQAGEAGAIGTYPFRLFEPLHYRLTAVFDSGDPAGIDLLVEVYPA